jgi:uncharacterized protein HemX
MNNDRQNQAPVQRNNEDEPVENTTDSTPEHAPQPNFSPNPEGQNGNNEQKSVGPAISIAIIVLVIILGGLYFWGAKLNRTEEQTKNNLVPSEQSGQLPEEIETAPDETLENLQQQSSSDEITDIENDLGTTDLENLDKELENIDIELNF